MLILIQKAYLVVMVECSWWHVWCLSSSTAHLCVLLSVDFLKSPALNPTVFLSCKCFVLSICSTIYAYMVIYILCFVYWKLVFLLCHTCAICVYTLLFDEYCFNAVLNNMAVDYSWSDYGWEVMWFMHRCLPFWQYQWALILCWQTIDHNKP